MFSLRHKVNLAVNVTCDRFILLSCVLGIPDNVVSVNNKAVTLVRMPMVAEVMGSLCWLDMGPLLWDECYVKDFFRHIFCVEILIRFGSISEQGILTAFTQLYWNEYSSYIAGDCTSRVLLRRVFIMLIRASSYELKRLYFAEMYSSACSFPIHS